MTDADSRLEDNAPPSTAEHPIHTTLITVVEGLWFVERLRAEPRMGSSAHA